MTYLEGAQRVIDLQKIITHRSMVTVDLKPTRSTIMKRAHQRARKELALRAKYGMVSDYAEVFAHELREAWGWVRAMQTGQFVR